MVEGNGANGSGESLKETLAELPPSELRALEGELRNLESSIMLARAQFARQAGMTFGGDRDEYKILGYDQQITTRQYRDEYARGGIAGRIIDVMPDATWRGAPPFELIEDEDPEKDTPFELAWKDLDTKHQICAKLQRVDRLSRLSTYAVLLIGAVGELEQELPRGTPEQLLYLMPFGGGGGPARGSSSIGEDSDCRVDGYESDARNPRFGLPAFYKLRRVDVNSVDLQLPVHWTRVVHIAEGLLDDEVFGQPALERVWNLLIDLHKVTGGGAEAFWLRANQGVHLDVDKDMALPDLKNTLEALKVQADNYKHQIDRWIRTKGVKAEILGSDVANFQSPADAIITQIAGAKGIPKRILTGSEMGELASSQDRENFKDLVNGRQLQYAGPYIVRPLIDRLIAYGYLPTPAGGPGAYEVRWPHIQTLTEQEKAEGAKRWADTVVDGRPVFPDSEIRDHWYGMAPLSEEQMQELLKARATLAPAPAPPAPAELPLPEPTLEAAEDAELLRVLTAAIEAGNGDVVMAILGDVTGHEFHGNQWSTGISSAKVDSLTKGGGARIKETLPNEVATVAYLHNTREKLEKAGWLANDWTPADDGSDIGSGVEVQFEKGEWRATLMRKGLTVSVGSWKEEEED